MQTLATIPAPSAPTKEDITSFIHEAFAQNKGLALWRFPNQSQLQGIVGTAQRFTSPSPLSTTESQGFIFAPFDNQNGHDKYFIPSETELEDFLISQKLTPSPTSKHGIKPTDIPEMYTQGFGTIVFSNQFEAQVKQAIDSIRSGFFQKVVLSETKTVTTPNLDIVKVFQNALEKYPSAFVSLVAIPSVGIWMGATPELLVNYTEDQRFETVALAGTKPFSDEVPLPYVEWSHKEIEEQAYVARYIVNCFKKIRVREYEENGPQTVAAGPLVHLKSTFTIDNKSVRYPDLAEVMLGLLHPTSAICGMPKESALNFIHQVEKLDRKYFSGYLGPISPLRGSSIFVNIRCMEIGKEKVRLYAGAGITAASLPEKEKKEIELKMAVMGSLIHEFLI